MPWIQLRIKTDIDHAEIFGDISSSLGAQAVTFLDANDDPVLEPKPGEVFYWPETIVVGLFDADVDCEKIRETLLAHPQSSAIIEYKFEQLEDKDWEREWMENFHPMQFGQRLWVCPSWRDIPDPTAVNVMLDPGLAFGTGTHPTTSLCLRWLDGLDLTGKTLVDFGCGSGILGIAALKLGASRVVGIDIDPQAILASRENARRNGVAEKIELYLPQDQPEIVADVVVANILAGPLRELKDPILSLLKEHGQFALSGILDTQAQDIAELYATSAVMDEILIDSEWARVSGIKHANNE